MQGVITRYFDEKGFGFIGTSMDDREGIFFHIKQCVDREYMPTIGDVVSFDVVPGREEGKTQANNVVFVSEGNHQSDDSDMAGESM